MGVLHGLFLRRHQAEEVPHHTLAIPWTHRLSRRGMPKYCSRSAALSKARFCR